MSHMLAASGPAVLAFLGEPALQFVRLPGRNPPFKPPSAVLKLGACAGGELNLALFKGRRRGWLLAMAILFLVLVSACKPETKPEAKPMTAGITGYNFTSEGVQRYSVNDMYGSNLPPYGGGGSLSCCVLLAPKWTPELRATVNWTIGHYTEPWAKRKHMTQDEENACCWTERTLTKTVPIEPYGEDGGDLQVFFLPNDEIKVYVSNYGLGHEKHPSGLAYPENPNPLPEATQR